MNGFGFELFCACQLQKFSENLKPQWKVELKLNNSLIIFMKTEGDTKLRKTLTSEFEVTQKPKKSSSPEMVNKPEKKRRDSVSESLKNPTVNRFLIWRKSKKGGFWRL